MSIGIFKHAEKFVNYEPGEVVFKEGDPCDIMYVVQDGEFDILVNGVVVETVGPNGIFGEMALVDTSPRSATVVAKTEARVVPLDESNFMSHVLRTPFFALQVIRVLASRLREMNSRLKNT